MTKKFQIKAGRFQIDKTLGSNKVKPNKSKGKLIVQRNQDQQTHLRWIDLQTKLEELDLIVFPTDAIFQTVQNKNNTFLLRFQTDPDKYFFWMQEKVEPQHVVTEIMKIINAQFQQQQQSNHSNKIQLEQPQQLLKQQPEKIQKPAQVSLKPIFAQDFISRLTKNLAAAQKPQETSVTHLQKIFNYGTIGQILKSLTEEDKLQLLQFLPQQQQDIKFFDSNVRSAQFLQATDALSEALNSQTAIAIFAEMSLNQNYLHKFYGVHAFLKALVDWGKQQKK